MRVSYATGSSLTHRTSLHPYSTLPRLLILSQPTAPTYRLYAVATLSLPQYRKKGLIPLCLSALKATLPPNSQLWIETAEESNGPYWRSRGFKMVKSEKKPAGFWGATGEFEWICLKG